MASTRSRWSTGWRSALGHSLGRSHSLWERLRVRFELGGGRLPRQQGGVDFLSVADCKRGRRCCRRQSPPPRSFVPLSFFTPSNWAGVTREKMAAVSAPTSARGDADSALDISRAEGSIGSLFAAAEAGARISPIDPCLASQRRGLPCRDGVRHSHAGATLPSVKTSHPLGASAQRRGR